MIRLCTDVIQHICSYLQDSEVAMFSITTKYLTKRVTRTTPLLDCFIRDSKLEWVKLAESWGCHWTDKSYIELGLTGNLALFEYKAFTKGFFFKSYALTQFESSSVYHGACSKGHIDLLQLIDSHSHEGHYLYGMEYAASVENYAVIEYLIEKHPDTILDISRVAIHNLNIELLLYCKNKNIKITGLDNLNKNVDPTQLDSFLKSCKEKGIKFHKANCSYSIGIIVVLLNHDLYDYHRISSDTCINLFESEGIINWSNGKHVKFVNKCIATLMLRSNTRLVDYFRMERFLIREGYVVDLNVYKNKLLDKKNVT